MESLQGRDETLLFSNFFFPIFFYILSLVSRRCGWGRSFNVWNSSFRSKNGELGRSVGFWNRLSAPWTCIFRYLKMVHGANQREPLVLSFSVENDRHQRRRLYFSSVRAFDEPAFLVGSGNPSGVFLLLAPCWGERLAFSCATWTSGEPPYRMRR